MAQKVIVNFPWAIVKDTGRDSFDLWEWNVWKLKWVRLAHTGQGFRDLTLASQAAEKRSNEIQAMFDANRNIPRLP